MAQGAQLCAASAAPVAPHTVHDSFGELSTEPRCAFERVVGGPTRTRFERILLASNRSAPGRVTSQAILSIGVAATPSSAPLYVRDDPERERRSTNGSRRYSGSGRP